MNTLLLAAVLLCPIVHGSSVGQHDLVLPRDLAGKPAVVVVTFGQDQQIEADSWLPLVQDIQSANPGIGYKEISVSDINDRLTRGTVDAYYSFAVQDPQVYENTVVLCAKRSSFMRALHLPTDHTIYTLLLDASGHVRWRSAGIMTPLHGEELREVVAELLRKG